MEDETIKSIFIFEDADGRYDLSLSVNFKRSSIDITKEQAEQLKKDLGVTINYIPF